MKAMLRILTVCSLLFAAVAANATIRYVSPNPGSAPFTTFSTAYNAAVTGDTIVLGPGSYVEPFGMTNKRVHVIGAGWDVCSWQGYIQIYNPASTGTVMEGIRFIGSGSHNINTISNVDSLTFRRCLFNAQAGYVPLYLTAGKTFVNDCVLNASTNHCVYLQTSANGNVVFRNTVFNMTTPVNGYYAISGSNGGTVEIYNSAFLNFVSAFNVTGVPQVIGLNNIFWDWNATATYGTLPVGSVFEYTAAGNGAPAFPASFTNNISLGANNPFVTYDNTFYTYPASNLHLNAGTGGLLCTDAGYPSILDLDNSPSDLGIYGGPKPMVDHGIVAFPFAITLNIDNLVEVGDSVNVVSSGRIGPRY